MKKKFLKMARKRKTDMSILDIREEITGKANMKRAKATLDELKDIERTNVESNKKKWFKQDNNTYILK